MGQDHTGGRGQDEDHNGREHRANDEDEGGSLVGSEDLDDSWSCKVRLEDAKVSVEDHHDVVELLEVAATAGELEDEDRDDVKALSPATGVVDSVVKAVHSAGDDEVVHPICGCGDLQNLDEREPAVYVQNVISTVE